MDETQLTVTVARSMFAGAMVEVTGVIDVTSSGRLAQRLSELITSGHPRLVVDLSRVGLCDASGLRALLSAREQAETAGGMFRLIAPQPIVAKVLDITGLDQVLDVTDESPAVTNYRVAPARAAQRRDEDRAPVPGTAERPEPEPEPLALDE
jgi:anti-anti-sigma factor